MWIPGIWRVWLILWQARHRHSSLILEQDLLRLCIAVCVKREPTGQVQVRLCFDCLEKSVFIRHQLVATKQFFTYDQHQMRNSTQSCFLIQDLPVMSAAHYVAQEHTLLHQASKLSFCYRCVCLLESIPFFKLAN